MDQRQLSSAELADLSSHWENSKVDSSKYYDAVITAWEVSEEFYVAWKQAGGLCQQQNNKYYIA